MLSDRIGVRRDDGGRPSLHTRRDEVGHAVFGPYRPTLPGVYRIGFTVSLLAGPRDSDGVCATLDVAAQDGQAVLAVRHLRTGDLLAGDGTFTLDVTLWEFRSLEFRVFVHGTADLLVADEPTLERLSDPAGKESVPDPTTPTSDPRELGRKVRAVLRLLRPQRVRGFRKVRIGSPGDGGHVCIDDFAGIDTALSFGLHKNISWDKAVADRGLRVFQFDPTTDDPDPEDDRLSFARKALEPERGPAAESLPFLVRELDRGRLRPNLILKLDGTGDEWAALAAVDPHDIGRFAQIVCELPYLQGLAELEWRRRIHTALAKLHEQYAVFHVHANICGGISNVGNVIFPNVLTVAFAHRELYQFEDTDELFPGPLDLSCDANQPDMFLGSFRY